MFNTSREFDITSFDSQITHKIFHIILESCWEKPLGINAGGEASSVLLKWTCWHLSLFDTNQGSFYSQAIFCQCSLHLDGVEGGVRWPIVYWRDVGRQFIWHFHLTNFLQAYNIHTDNQYIIYLVIEALLFVLRAQTPLKM